jgi:hypothetical protein
VKWNENKACKAKGKINRAVQSVPPVAVSWQKTINNLYNICLVEFISISPAAAAATIYFPYSARRREEKMSPSRRRGGLFQPEMESHAHRSSKKADTRH